jgi:hypothetical protein
MIPVATCPAIHSRLERPGAVWGEAGKARLRGLTNMGFKGFFIANNPD